jgi:hypothetical protein
MMVTATVRSTIRMEFWFIPKCTMPMGRAVVHTAPARIGAWIW